jgi:hypothetical protein
MIIGGVMIPANIARANWKSAGCFSEHLAKESYRRGAERAPVGETPPKKKAAEEIY